MQDTKQILKEDINFLEHPNWVLDRKVKMQRLVIQKQQGTYEIVSPEGLPTHFDKIVLYALLYQLLKYTKLESCEFTTTRYQIAKDIFDKAIHDPYQFERIMKALKKWKSISIYFEGTFYEKDNYTIRGFSIIDDYILDTVKKQLFIRFNQQYVLHLKQTQFYKYIDFAQYKKLKRSVSARLYEILIKTFKGRSKWHIGIQTLAEKLTLEKRPNTKVYYPSDVIAKLIPAIAEINDKTDLCIKFEYDKQADLFFFTDMTSEYKKLHNTDQDRYLEPATTVVFNKSDLVHVIIAWGISQKKAQELITTYSEQKIRHKLALLQAQKDTIKKPAGWLMKALEQDWDAQAYEKHLQEQQLKQETRRKWQEQEAQRKLIEKLTQQHAQYIETKAHGVYKLLPAKIAKIYDQQYITWLQERKQHPFGKYVPDEVHRLDFLKEMVLDEVDVDFKLWAQAQGHKLTL